MRDGLTGEVYLKYNGLKSLSANHIAEYLISIPSEDRKKIIDSMLTTTTPNAFKKILDFYQKLLNDGRNKSEYLIKARKVVVCDMSGVLH